MRSGLIAAAVVAVGLLAGCAPRFAAPFQLEAPRVDAPRSVASTRLATLPPPREPVVVAVYRFRDQTGQYRALENVSTFSTAVTQGATSILMRALEDSRWFVPIEREGLSNLLNERQIISSTRQQFTGPDGQPLGPLPPLLYAGVLLEGGVIGYDTNLITGGAGVRFLGAGGSGQFRQDQVTIYLRAISVQNGRVLKTVHVTKTILSQKLDGGLFRFVELRQLLETEAGYSTNEPPVLAVTAAIEEAVTALIVEGVRDQLWQLANAGDALELFTAYDARVAQDARRDAFDRLAQPRLPGGLAVELGGGVGRLETDFAERGPAPAGLLSLRVPVRGGWSAGVTARAGAIDAGGAVGTFVGGETTARWRVSPLMRTSPVVGLGVGALLARPARGDGGTYPFVSAELGLEHRLSQSSGISLGVSNLLPLRDGFDGIRASGGVPDNLWMVRAGLILYGIGG